MSRKKKNKNDSQGSNDIYDAEYIVKHKIENGQTFYRVKWKGWSERHNTWEPVKNILDERLIEQYEKKLDDAKKQLIKREDRSLPKVDKRYLDKIAKLTKSNDELKLINSNAAFEFSINECAIKQSKDDKTDKEVYKDESDKKTQFSTELTKSTERQKINSSNDKSNDFNLLKNELKSTELNDDLNISSNSLNDSTDEEEDSTSNDNLIIDSRSSEDSVDKTLDKPNNLKRKFDSVELTDNSVKYPNFQRIDFLVKQINAKVNQTNEQMVKKILDNGQHRENSVYPSNLIDSKFNCVKSDLSFQDLLSANYPNHNKSNAYKPEFLKKKSNLLDQVVITDVTANDTTITVRESKSQKFFFKDKKVQM